jgi:hypothetical protein
LPTKQQADSSQEENITQRQQAPIKEKDNAKE